MKTLHHPFNINHQGHLEIGGVDTIDLTKKYGTPLYVYDVSLIRKNARAFVKTFETLGIQAQIAYASKAFSSIAMVEVANEEGLSLDIVSEGELYTALQAGFQLNAYICMVIIKVTLSLRWQSNIILDALLLIIFMKLK